MPLVSVIIPSWNRKEDLRRTLQSVLGQDFEDFEVIVIDNGSTDGSVELVEKEFPSVRLQKNPVNRGVSIAKNMGVLLAQGEFVHFLDSDIEMTHPNIIRIMVQILETHPEIGALGGEAYKTEKGVVTKRKEITANCETSTYIMDTDSYQLFPCGYVATCNCMMRKRDIERCHGFDNKIMYAGEDKEIGYKLRKMGLQSVVDSRNLVYHYMSETSRASVFYAFHKNRMRIFFKNYPLYILPLLPLLDIANTLSLKKFQELKQNNRDVTKWVSSEETKLRHFLFVQKIVYVGSVYAFALGKAYASTLLSLPEILFTRLKRPNNLEEVEKRWLLQRK